MIENSFFLAAATFESDRVDDDVVELIFYVANMCSLSRFVFNQLLESHVKCAESCSSTLAVNFFLLCFIQNEKKYVQNVEKILKHTLMLFSLSLCSFFSFHFLYYFIFFCRSTKLSVEK